MSSRSARREYLEAMAQFERACLDFSRSMASIAEPAPAAPSPAGVEAALPALGPRKPAKRAPRATILPASSQRRA